MLKLIDIENLYTIGNVRNEKDGDLMDLMHSIETYGLMEPLVVKEKDENGNYEIISGHRRFEALKLLHESPVECNIMSDVDSKRKLAMQVIENEQRKNMSAYDLCAVFDEYKKKGYKNKQIAAIFNKPESWVQTNYEARAILEREYKSGIPAEKKKLTAGKIHAEKKLKTEGKPEINYYQGFAVKRMGHKYQITVGDYAFEKELNLFFEQFRG